MDATQIKTGGTTAIPRSAGRPTLLVATDGSDASLHAAETAVGLAGFLRARLHVLYVVDEDRAFHAGIHYGEAFKELTAFGERTTGEISSLAQKAGVEHEETVAAGDPAGVILSVADDIGADYVVLGSHGTSRLGHALFGSVAEEVLRRADRRVLVVGGKPARVDGPLAGRLETSGA